MGLATFILHTSRFNATLLVSVRGDVTELTLTSFVALLRIVVTRPTALQQVHNLIFAEYA